MSEIKTRFAPSPTGYLHIGGARTALFNWLFARHHGGKFVLRVEDTDQERSTDESVDEILDSLEWLGLDLDEGPYFQSERRDIYLSHIKKLLDEKKAYRCYCTKEELDEKRATAMSEGRKPKYDGTCRERTDFPDGEAYVIRFRSPDSGATVVDDLIKGEVSFENSELDDLVIARSDGSPTYNFVVVIDDATMGISHIIRGDDHLNNTPRQILLYHALGYKAPIFGHVPLILGKDKKRLSKRHGATAVTAYRDMGYLPHAIVNYLARLGWSHGDQEIFSPAELIKYFDSDQIGKSASVFDEEKLLWLNSHYIKESSNADLKNLVQPHLEDKNIDISSRPDIESVINLLKERARTIEEMSVMAEVYYADEVSIDENAAAKFLTSESTGILEELALGIKEISPFTEETIEIFFKNYTEEKGIKMRKVGPPLRVALTGGTNSPGIFEVMALLGKDVSLKRIKRVCEQHG